MKRAIFFDMDGLLIDSGPVWEHAYDHVLSGYGLEFSHASYLETSGMRLREAVAYWSRKGLYDASDCGAVYDAIHSYVMTAIADCPYMPGAEQFLSAVHALPVHISLVTATEREVMEHVVRTRGWDHIFETITTGDDVKEPKPNPEAYLSTAEGLGVTIEDCIVFEDSVPGILAGVRSGAYTIAIPKKGTEKQDVLAQASEVHASLETVTLEHIQSLIS